MTDSKHFIKKKEHIPDSHGLLCIAHVICSQIYEF